MLEMFSAKDARDARDARESADSVDNLIELQGVFAAVKLSVNFGRTYYRAYTTLSPIVIDRLIGLGYIVDINVDHTTITW